MSDKTESQGIATGAPDLDLDKLESEVRNYAACGYLRARVKNEDALALIELARRAQPAGAGELADDDAKYAVIVDQRDLFDNLRAAWREGSSVGWVDGAESWHKATDYAETAIKGWNTLRAALTHPSVSASHEQDEDEESAEDGWRRLALQFDGHRMQALCHLRAMLQDPVKHAPVAIAFLNAPPLSGEEVLAQRITALTQQPSAAPSVQQAGAPAQAQPDMANSKAAFKKWHDENGDQDCDYTWQEAWNAALSASPSAPAVQAEPIGYVSRATLAKLQGEDLAADEHVMLWHAANPPSRAVVPLYTGAAPAGAAQANALPPPELTWLYTHCRAIGMDCKSESGKWEHDIALFTINLTEERDRIRVAPPFAAPASQRYAGDLVAQPRLYARLMEMSEIIRAGSRWDGNEQAFANKSESDVAMLDDILGDALRLAAEPPCEQSSVAGAAKGGETSTDSSKNLAAQTTTASASGDERDLEGALKMIKRSNDILAAALTKVQEERDHLRAARTPAPSRSATPAESFSRIGRSVATGIERIIVATAISVEWADRIVAALAAPAGGEDARAKPVFNILPTLTHEQEVAAGKGVCPACSHSPLKFINEANGMRFLQCEKCKDITVIAALSTMQQSTEGGA